MDVSVASEQCPQFRCGCKPEVQPLFYSIKPHTLTLATTNKEPKRQQTMVEANLSPHCVGLIRPHRIQSNRPTMSIFVASQ